MPESNLDPDALLHAAELIDQADGLIIAAGAGIGVDSGLPDFRGNTGFWKAYPALARAGLEFTAVASPRTFASDPHLAWGFYGHRLALYRDTFPHEGFSILKRWADDMLLGSFIYTSNVDGQFQRAGFDERSIVECHGTIHQLQCSRPCTWDLFPADSLHPVVDHDACRWIGDLPSCPHCGSLARPNILMFGDGAWVGERSQGQASRLQAWLETVGRPVVIEIGAGTAVQSVRYFSQTVIHEHGGRMVRINVREPAVPSRHDVGFAAGALETLQAIDQVLKQLP